MRVSPADLPRLSLSVILAGLAGWVDAVGYLHLGGTFVSFMSGNSTLLGLAIGREHLAAAAGPAVVILCFVAGAFGGRLLPVVLGRWRHAGLTGAEAGLLAAAAVLADSDGAPLVSAVPLALAMGAQNAGPRQVGGLAVGLTYVSGVLVRLGSSLADACLGRADGGRWPLYAAVWVALTVGAAVGAVAWTRLGASALLAPAAVLAALALAEAGRAVLRRDAE